MAKKDKKSSLIGSGEVKRMKLSDLVPADYNPRTITEIAKDGLKESINKFGMLNLIVWNEKSKNVVGGHQRLKVLIEQGETETDVLIVSLDDKEEIALNIALNNHAIQGDFSAEALEALKMTEVNLGDMFNKLQLKPIMSKLEKKIEKGKKKEAPMEKEDSLEVINDRLTEVLIVCPECRSKWRMRDNVVVENKHK